MTDRRQVELLIIGSGEAGKYLAWTMAKAGRSTMVVERRWIGGSCPNIACLPSKNIIHSAKVAHLTRRGTEFGIRTGSVAVDMCRVQARKRQMVDGLRQMHLEKYEASGAELLLGQARFVAPKTVQVTTGDGHVLTITGDQVCLNVGTRAAIPHVPGLQEAGPMTHIEALNLDQLPEHLVVLGGGFVGLEMAQALRRLGSRVTILERGQCLASNEDPDIAEELLQLFEDEGIDVKVNTELAAVEGRSGQRIRLSLNGPKGECTIDASDLLVATGRVPNTENLGLADAGVEVDNRGYIRVNDRLQTTAPDVWAMGDCAGSPNFTHVSYDDFRVVRDNLNGVHKSTTGRLVPFCVFTDPELARVGLNETEARRQGVPYRLAKMPMTGVLRTRTISEPRGLMKALISQETSEILGFTAFGAEASELMAAVQTAMLARLPYTGLRDALFAHPTMAEGLIFLMAAVA